MCFSTSNTQRELERNGVILAYRAILDKMLLASGIIVYVTVGLNDYSKEFHEAFERSIAAAARVVEITSYIVMGAVKDERG